MSESVRRIITRSRSGGGVKNFRLSTPLVPSAPIRCSQCTTPLQPVHHHGRRKDFFQGGPVVHFSKIFSRGGKIGFYPSKLKKQPFLPVISKSRGGLAPPIWRPCAPLYCRQCTTLLQPVHHSVATNAPHYVATTHQRKSHVISSFPFISSFQFISSFRFISSFQFISSFRHVISIH